MGREQPRVRYGGITLEYRAIYSEIWKSPPMSPEHQTLQATRAITDGVESQPISDDAVKAQLERLKTSVQFRSSKRCVLFLDYVVHALLNGHTEFLKERTLGVEVFGRAPNYDTNQDPVVRGTASEVRKRLAQYYQLPGHERQLRIDLPAGSYAPEFHAGAVEVLPEPAPPVIPVPATPVVIPKRTWDKRKFIGVAAAVATIVTAATLVFPGRKPSNVLDQFWAPVLFSQGSVLICVGQPLIYNLLGNLNVDVESHFTGHSTQSANSAITANFNEFAPNSDRYLALGDAMCLSDLTALFSRKSRAYHVRGGGSTSFADLREDPAVLIGAFTNDWNMRLMGELRFSFKEGPQRLTQYVYDRQNPNRRDWQLKNVWPDWKMPQDYAIVSRVLYTSTGKPAITAAGITHYGTSAAGEFLTNPDYLRQALKNAPADWQRRNMQIVLVTKVIEGTSGPPQVVATYFW